MAPFHITFGEQTFSSLALAREDLYRRLGAGEHATTSQATPQDWARAYKEAGAGGLPVLAITISAGLSSSASAAEQARSLVQVPVTVMNSQSLSGAQGFMVYAAAVASQRGESLETGLAWAEAVRSDTEFYFTIETLDYLRRGGRIGRVAAAMGGLLNLKPIITVEQPAGTYVNVARVRSYKGAIKELAAQVTARFGAGTPLRAGFLHGSHPEDAAALREAVAAQHQLVWEGTAGVNPVLTIHTGPRVVGMCAALGNWPWEPA
ncbi:DegV family protein [Deinococcus lacus]|uniref:DegV family protein n=1 Tax=Deinococcus lacus TaxID=392561 RepID=A0ABW1YAE3_9DEIO